MDHEEEVCKGGYKRPCMDDNVRQPDEVKIDEGRRPESFYAWPVDEGDDSGLELYT